MSQPEIDTSKQYENTPTGWAQRWAVEMDASDAETKDWREEAEKLIRYYASKRALGETFLAGPERWNLFAANVLTISAMLYGRVPEVGVGRKFADSADDVARVASTILERMLNSDIQGDDDPYALALEQVLWDRLVPGLGVARVRYELEEGETNAHEDDSVPMAEVEEDAGQGGGELLDMDAGGPAPALSLSGATPQSPAVATHQCVKVEYVHWNDFRWSAGGRTWHEVRFTAFRHRISRETGEKDFTKEIWDTVPMQARDASKSREESGKDPWARAEVWEIWDKDSRKVYWWVRGAPACLRIDEDPLGLASFWPCPRPLIANPTTSEMVPIPDFRFAADQYRAIDKVVTRLGMLTDALKVRGVYDGKQPSIKKLLTEGGGNDLIPVENWAMLGEAGGIKGVVDWFPLEQVVNTIVSLEERLDRMKGQLDEVTGMSDILRGQSASVGVTATEQGIKAHFASARLQRLQDEFARFASECQQLKAELIGNPDLFSPASILEASNIEATPDAQLAPQAIALLQSGKSDCRVKVAPENLALADFAQLKQDRMEVLGAIGAFTSAVMPLVQALPTAMPLVLGMLQWMVAGIKGGGDIEGLLDKAIDEARAAQQQPQQGQAPDPKLQAQMLKGQQEQQKAAQEHQNHIEEIQVEVQGDVVREAAQARYGIQEAQMRHVLQQQGKAMAPKPGGQR